MARPFLFGSGISSGSGNLGRLHRNGMRTLPSVIDMQEGFCAHINCNRFSAWLAALPSKGVPSRRRQGLVVHRTEDPRAPDGV